MAVPRNFPELYIIYLSSRDYRAVDTGTGYSRLPPHPAQLGLRGLRTVRSTAVLRSALSSLSRTATDAHTSAPHGLRAVGTCSCVRSFGFTSGVGDSTQMYTAHRIDPSSYSAHSASAVTCVGGVFELMHSQTIPPPHARTLRLQLSSLSCQLPARSCVSFI